MNGIHLAVSKLSRARFSCAKERYVQTATVRWQEWASFALGLWLAVSPWLADYADSEAATANAAVVGLLLALGSHIQVSLDENSAEWLNLAIGLWLLAAPFTVGFTSASDGARRFRPVARQGNRQVVA